MDIYILSKILKKQLLSQKKVAIPYWGYMEQELVPAVVSSDGKSVSPQLSAIVFKPFKEEAEDDPSLCEDLIHEYANARAITESHARSVLLFYLKSVKQQCISVGEFSLPGIGKFAIAGDSVVSFCPEQTITYKPVIIEPLKRRGEVEIIRKSKRSRVLSIVLLSVILIMALIVVLAVIFRDELRPLWERLLYNEEERAILQKMLRR